MVVGKAQLALVYCYGYRVGEWCSPRCSAAAACQPPELSFVCPVSWVMVCCLCSGKATVSFYGLVLSPIADAFQLEF